MLNSITLARFALFVLAGSLAIAIATPRKLGPDSRKRAIPTFAADVAPILYSKCASCHHAGEVAPFSLLSYSDAKQMAPTIAKAVKQKFMPPWQAVSHGEFVNERVLTAEQIDCLEAWAKNGAPAGDLKKAPAPPSFTPGWQMGAPDFVGKPDRPYEVSSEGTDDYRCFVIPTSFNENRFVTSVELRPGNRRVVHHVLVYLDTKGVARQKRAKDGKPGYESFGGPGFPPSGSLGGWAPGLQPQILTAGNGFLLPKGADIVLQVHYHKNGKPESDLTQIGLKFAKSPVDKEVRWEDVGEEVFSIPAGQSSYEVTATRKLPRPVTILDIIPHMHLLGHDMTVVAKLPNGTTKPLIKVANYDFNWQTRYAYREPIHLPAGTELDLVAHYDNTTKNPHNPNSPVRDVTFGEQTTDEMCYAFFSYTFDNEHIANGVRVAEDTSAAEREVGHIFDKFDANHDGFLDADELAALIRFFEKPAAGKPDDSMAQAKMAIAVYGKAQKGKVNRAEFLKLAAQAH